MYHVRNGLVIVFILRLSMVEGDGMGAKLISAGLMVNFVCQLDGVIQCPDI